jgi:hypothetical protein
MSFLTPKQTCNALFSRDGYELELCTELATVKITCPEIGTEYACEKHSRHLIENYPNAVVEEL